MDEKGLQLGTMTYYVALAFKRSEDGGDMLPATRKRHPARLTGGLDSLLKPASLNTAA